MYGFQIEDVLRKFPNVHKHLRGVVSIDQIPQRLKKMDFIIVNESVKDSKGTHWIVIMRDIHGCYICFDPLGINELKEEMLQKYVPKYFQLIYNTNSVQNSKSASCGEFCSIYFSFLLINFFVHLNEYLTEFFCYSSVPNMRTGPNKPTGWNFDQNTRVQGKNWPFY